MFKLINDISDVQSAVDGVKEIRFNRQQNGITIGCYMFMDSRTFDTPEALECRGVAFSDDGKIVSRPLHKFFNIGEKDWLTTQKLTEREEAGEIAAIYEKLDGSMIASALVNGQLQWRSKKAFHSDVVRLANEYLAQDVNSGVQIFSEKMAREGYTVILELTHPLARIVVAQDAPNMQVLHVRDNNTGEYVLLDPSHMVHSLIREHNVPLVRRFSGMKLDELLASLEGMSGQEGYVVQFKNGDMVKIKCPWYIRLHHSITFLRERDIAILALNEELDDVKGALKEAGIDLTAVNAVESRLKRNMLSFEEEIERVCNEGRVLDRKDFAIKNKENAMFGLIMARYSGKEASLADWYGRNQLKEDFSLRVLADGAVAEEMGVNVLDKDPALNVHDNAIKGVQKKRKALS